MDQPAVLVVHDTLARMASSVRNVLEQSGISVEVVGTAEEAIDFLGTADLILVDIELVRERGSMTSQSLVERHIRPKGKRWGVLTAYSTYSAPWCADAEFVFSLAEGNGLYNLGDFVRSHLSAPSG